jgi:hypothetical protein
MKKQTKTGRGSITTPAVASTATSTAAGVPPESGVKIADLRAEWFQSVNLFEDVAGEAPQDRGFFKAENRAVVGSGEFDRQ